MVRKRRIKQRLLAAMESIPEQGPSTAGWAVYIASAVAFAILCMEAALR